MTDALTTWITASTGRFAAGCVIFYGVMKLFKEIEERVNNETKIEVWVWLAGHKDFGPKIQRWPQTFTEIFDGIFGSRHLSFLCFRRSCVSTSISFLVLVTIDMVSKIAFSQWYAEDRGLEIVAIAFGVNIVTDYVALLETRFCLAVMKRTNSVTTWICILFLDAYVTVFVGVTSFFAIIELLDLKHFNITRAFALLFSVFDVHFAMYLYRFMHRNTAHIFAYPALITSAALWLYAGSGFLVKAARRFDIGFRWFNKHFDIEKKPLSSLGFVAASLSTLLYWSVALIGWARR